jgi:hypothetical protein
MTEINSQEEHHMVTEAFWRNAAKSQETPRSAGKSYGRAKEGLLPEPLGVFPTNTFILHVQLPEL